MGIARFAAAAALIVFASPSAWAQPAERPLTPLETAVACAPPTSFDAQAGSGLRIIGSQDTVARSVFDRGDLLVLSGGTGAGVRLGQRYYIRRPVFFGTNRSMARAEGFLTLGWLRVVAVNDMTAIATVDHFCSAISAGDLLQPFAPPDVPAGAEQDNPRGELDFESLGRVLYGVENRRAGGGGDLMLIDRGADQGVAPGARFAVYRDVHAGVPLSSVGEAVVVSIGKTMSLARITRSRDAIVSGDYVVARK